MMIKSKWAKFETETEPVQGLKGKENWEYEQREKGQFSVQLCTEKQCNLATLMAFLTNFATNFFHTVFTRRTVSDWTLRRDQKVVFVKVQFLDYEYFFMGRVLENFKVCLKAW